MFVARPRPGGPLVAFAVAILAFAACSTHSSGPADAALDQLPSDSDAPADAGPSSLALDFAATGCASFSTPPDLPACHGSAPLTVTFTPLASPELDQFVWDFGDGKDPSTDRSPAHVYDRPGMFDVQLTAGGPRGTVGRTHASYIVVAPAPIGARCDVQEQCATQTCVCGSDATCPPVLLRGFCTSLCTGTGGDCGAGVCVDFSPGGPSPPLDPMTNSWRFAICLARCATDDDCATGFSCRDLPAAGALANPWTRACFASYPFPLGTRCRNLTGDRVSADCATRLCADLGAYGLCSSDCTTAPCPPGGACARFGDGRTLCLAACGTDLACDGDPALGCERPGAPGPLGFTLVGGAASASSSGGAGGSAAAAASATYCAPRSCATSMDCGAATTCPAGGGHCAAQ